jgi:PAS domain S-box-containing protein
MHVISIVRRWFVASKFADYRDGTYIAGIFSQAIVFSLLVTGLFFAGTLKSSQGLAVAGAFAGMLLLVLFLNRRLLHFALRTQASADQEIARRKQLETELGVREHRLRLLADNTRDVIWTMTPAGRISYMGPSVLALRGFTSDETKQQPLEEILSPTSHAIVVAYFNQLYADLVTSSAPRDFHGELEYLCRNGTTVWTEVVAFPLQNDEGEYEILGMTRDISQHQHQRRRVELEKQGRRLEDQIVQLDRQRSLGQMSAALGHELNQPLTAILTNAQAMQRSLRTGRLDSTQTEEFLGRIIQNTRRTSDIIEKIRTYIRPNETAFVTLDLQTVLLDTLDLLVTETQQSRIVLKFLRSEHPVLVRGDLIQLSQVLLNTLRNAIEALQQVAQREIEIQISTQKAQVQLTITDTGPGLTQQDLEKVGTPFFTTKSNGLGLGLSISRNIMARFQGTLSIANASPVGVCVTVALPMAQRPP